jgi:hypothetical protein
MGLLGTSPRPRPWPLRWLFHVSVAPVEWGLIQSAYSESCRPVSRGHKRRMSAIGAGVSATPLSTVYRCRPCVSLVARSPALVVGDWVRYTYTGQPGHHMETIHMVRYTSRSEHRLPWTRTTGVVPVDIVDEWPSHPGQKTASRGAAQNTCPAWIPGGGSELAAAEGVGPPEEETDAVEAAGESSPARATPSPTLSPESSMTQVRSDGFHPATVSRVHLLA